MKKLFLVSTLIGCIFLNGCGEQQKALDALYAELYADVPTQLDDGYTVAQLKALDTPEKVNKYFSIGFKKTDSLIQKLITATEAALAESSGAEAEKLIDLRQMYKSYQQEARQAINLLGNYKKSCPDAASRPAGTLPSHACGDVFLTVEDLKSASLVCVYYVSAKKLADFPGFDKSQVQLLNSTMTAEIISQGCEAFKDSTSLLGYPHRTSKWVVPEKMRTEVTSELVIAIGDGLFTNLVDDVPILEQAVNGKWFGYCSAFKNVERKLENGSKTGNCY